jgi:excisionase family DNA binding protein
MRAISAHSPLTMLGTGTLFRDAGLGQDAPHRRGDDIRIPILALCFLCLSQTIEVVETMLKTSAVAHMLGVSRQHVVDMCDRGELRCVRVGTHRRIPHSEVDRLIGSDLRREEEQSLWLHYALLAPLLTEPEIVIAKARENLLRWSKKHRRDGMAIRYLAKWERVLDDGLDEIIHALTSPSQEARELRQNSPFAGVLADATRQRVLKTFKRHWAQRHGQDLTSADSGHTDHRISALTSANAG